MPKGMREVPVSQFTAAAAVEIQNPARILGFAAMLCLVLVRFGALHELLTYAFGVRLMLQYVFGLPALLALVVTGGIRRAFRGRIMYYWSAYALWMFVAVLFSTWKGDSARLSWAYLRSEMIVPFVIAGLTITWRECKMMLRAIGCGGILLLAAARLFRDSSMETRLGLAFGTIGNANDYACVLLLLLPFVLWFALSAKWVVVRLAVVPVLAFGVYAILSTASRGALLGLLAETAVFLYLGAARQRVALLALGGIVLAVAGAALPQEAKERILSFSPGAGGLSAVSSEAAESRTIREYMLRKSIEYTFTHPLFGVGPGQMVNYEGPRSKTAWSNGVWQDAHNSFIQVSSECGIPALLFFVAGLVSTYRLLGATHRKARLTPDCGDIRTAVFCIMVGMAGFCVGITFLNFAYLFYAPALGGLAIAVSAAAEAEFEKRSAGAATAGI